MTKDDAQRRQYDQLSGEAKRLLELQKPRSPNETVRLAQEMKQVRDGLWHLIGKNPTPDQWDDHQLAVMRARHEGQPSPTSPWNEDPKSDRPLRNEEQETRRFEMQHNILVAIDRFDRLSAEKRHRVLALRPEERKEFEGLAKLGKKIAKEGIAHEQKSMAYRSAKSATELNAVCDQMETLLKKMPPSISEKRKSGLLRRYAA